MKSTKETILRAAIEMIAEKGYHCATMDDIAVEAKVAKGTLYYHFNSKEDVFNSIIQNGIELIKKEIDTGIEGIQDPVEKLKIVCKSQLRLIYTRRNFFKIILSQLWGQELRHQEIRKTAGLFILYIQGFIEGVISSGRIECKNPKLLTYTLVGTICSTAIYKLIEDEYLENWEIEQLDELSNYLLKSIGI